MTSTNFKKILDHLWIRVDEKSDQYLYAILDPARNEKIYPAMVESNIEYRCLYKGDIPQVLAEVSPYLVRFHKGSKFLEMVVKEGWADSWGIFLTSSAMFKELDPHFRDFIMAKDEEGNTFYFRYYDPRVLRVYLPTCNESELRTIFGPVKYYFVEQEEGRGLIEYLFEDKSLGVQEVDI